MFIKTMLILVCFIYMPTIGCERTVVDSQPTSPVWKSLGLTGKWVRRVVLAEPFLYACGIIVPALAPDGTAFVLDVDSLYAISSYGQKLWSRNVSSVSSPPTVDAEGNIYLAHHSSTEKRITCFSPDGSLKWQIKDLPQATTIGGTPLGPDGTLFFGTQNRAIFYAIE